MDLSNPFYIDAIWLSIAFLCGLLAKRVGLPPLVGFLIAGFLINFSGFHDGKLDSSIDALADIGVMLLLFTIGLKLKVKSLLKPEIWATASIHMIISILALASLMFLMSFGSIFLLSDLSFQSFMMISFALSFSSTVFVVKTLENRGEFNSYHGKVAIGILIIQDIFAVLFIAFSSQKTPSIWVISLPLILYIVRLVLGKLLSFLEHGEMIAVFGFFATFIAGAFSFSLVGLKADLGALVIGMLLVDHPKSDELYDRMIEYKDFFLIAFFINVGLTGIPNASIIFTALIILPIIFFKGILFMLILARFNLRARTAYLTSLSLSNFSEFGLIVGVVGLNMGLLSNEWLITIAVLMSFSFFLSAPINVYSHKIFDKFKGFITTLNRSEHYIDTEPQFLGDAEFIVLGIGSIGLPAYKALNDRYSRKVVALDYSHEKVDFYKKQNMNVIWADTTDSELWENLDLTKIKAVFLAMSDFASNINTLEEIKKIENRKFKIFALCHYPDQSKKYEKFNVDYVFDYKENLGIDFVENALDKYQIK